MRFSRFYLSLALFSLVAGFAAWYISSLNKVEWENIFRIGSTDWEITKPVTRKAWASSRPGLTVRSDAEIEGYASLTSVNIGETIRFYVNSIEPYRIEFFRMGWYRGRGARKMHPEYFNSHPSRQPPCSHDSQSHRVECDWNRPYTLSVPTSWVSGVYLAKLTASPSGYESYIIFVVRDDEREADFLFQTSVTTYQAYNRWGGYSLYGSDRHNKPAASEVSFDRPYDQGYGSEGHEGAGDFLRWEINMLRWVERNGYDVTYASNIDVHRSSSLLSNRSAFLSVGHDEYWTEEMRTNIHSSLDQCVNLGFFSANSIYWRSRLTSNSRGNRLRTLVTHKDCLTDPTTTEWRNDCGGRIEAQPEDALMGVKFGFPIHMDNDLIVTNTDHWMFDGTGLEDGDRLIGLVGYEADKLGDHTPNNLIVVGESPTCPAVCRSRGRGACEAPVTAPCFCGESPAGESGVSNMTIYETDLGTTVFATGTIQWAWGLDDYESPQDTTLHCSRVQASAQKITHNIFSKLKTKSASCN